MNNREEGKTYPRSPMGGTPKAFYIDALQRNMRQVPTAGETALNSLIAAYNNKAFGMGMPAVSHYEGNVGDNIYNNYRLDRPNGDRIGFIGKDTNSDGVTYRAGLDLGDLNRDSMENVINTPLGELGYGYENDTDYGYFTPNAQTMAYVQILKSLLNR